MKLKERLTPALLVSESFFPLLGDEVRLLDAVERAVDSGFYTRLEISAMKTRQGRQRLREIARRYGLQITQWITNDLNELQLNPSAVESPLRDKTIAKMRELAEVAADSGADRMAFISGRDPGAAMRQEAARGLTQVMCAVAEKAMDCGLTLLLEPLDRGAHKDNFIGPTPEAVAILREVHQSQPNVLLSWDSAHVALNREDLQMSLALAMPYVGQLHLANAVLEREDPQFGDWHMPMGRPGFLTEETAYAIGSCAVLHLNEGEHLGITVESRCTSEHEIWEREDQNRRFLERVLEREVCL